MVTRKIKTCNCFNSKVVSEYFPSQANVLSKYPLCRSGCFKTKMNEFKKKASQSTIKSFETNYYIETDANSNIFPTYNSSRNHREEVIKSIKKK